jgi:hypothetical protein
VWPASSTGNNIRFFITITRDSDPGSKSAGLRIWDVYPGYRILIFTHPGSRIPYPKTATKERGDKKICCQTFFCSHKFHKIVNYFIFLNAEVKSLGQFSTGLALKNPPKKTQKNPPKKTHKKWGFLGFFGFFKFFIFYENNTNFSLSNRFFMNK